MTRVMIAAGLYQCRAYDGRKVSYVQTWENERADKWIERQIKSYKYFKNSVAKYENHRPRFAYCVKVYLKEK